MDAFLIRLIAFCALTGLFGALPASAQQRIAFLQTLPAARDDRLPAFKDKLRELGHVEGRTYSLDYRSAGGQYDRLPQLAIELARLKPDVIMTDGGTQALAAAAKATRSIPIVFSGVSDPVGQGFVARLANPGGNITGVSVQHPEFAPKSLELLRQMLPAAKRIAVLSNPKNSSLPPVVQQMQVAARALDLEIDVVHAAAAEDLESAFRQIGERRAAGVVILRDAVYTSNIRRLVVLAAKAGLPTMGGDSAFPESGGLASYGPNTLDMTRRCAVLVDKILKGEKPADIAVEQPPKFDLVVNRATAATLGVRLPQAVLLRADRVID